MVDSEHEARSGDRRKALLREMRKEAAHLEGELVALGMTHETLGELLVALMRTGDSAAVNVVSRLCDAMGEEDRMLLGSAGADIIGGERVC